MIELDLLASAAATFDRGGRSSASDPDGGAMGDDRGRASTCKAAKRSLGFSPCSTSTLPSTNLPARFDTSGWTGLGLLFAVRNSSLLKERPELGVSFSVCGTKFSVRAGDSRVVDFSVWDGVSSVDGAHQPTKTN